MFAMSTETGDSRLIWAARSAAESATSRCAVAMDRLTSALTEYDEWLGRTSAAETHITETLATVELEKCLRDLHAAASVLSVDELLTEVDAVDAEGRDDPCSASPLPCQLGRFRIISRVAEGGHGIVLSAWDELLERRVAIKIPLPRLRRCAGLKQMFLMEMRAAARLNHPNIVSLLEAAETGPFLYAVQPWCAGSTLRAWLRSISSPMPIGAATRFVSLLAVAMHYAHGQGVLHRDLKPSNVLLAPCEPGNAHGVRLGRRRWSTPMICDFGSARYWNPGGGDSRQPSICPALGTVPYIAPEEMTEPGVRSGPWTDVFSLGAIFYELLTGAPPFQAEDFTSTSNWLLSGRPPWPLRQSRADVPDELERICLKCLAREPVERYASAAALAGALSHWLRSERAPLAKREPDNVAGAACVALSCPKMSVYSCKQRSKYRRRPKGQSNTHAGMSGSA